VPPGTRPWHWLLSGTEPFNVDSPMFQRWGCASFLGYVDVQDRPDGT
jgi:hypothetical protein